MPVKRCRKGDRLIRGKLGSHPRSQAEFDAQARGFGFLCGLVSDRDLSAAEVDEPTCIDPRRRRIAIYEGRQDSESVALAVDFHTDARPLAATYIRQLGGLDLQRDAFAEIRQDVRHEFCEMLVGIEMPARQVGHFAPRQPIRCERVNRVGAKHDAVSIGAFDAPILLGKQAYATRRFDDAHQQAERLLLDRNRLPVEKDSVAADQSGHDLAESRTRGRGMGTRPEMALDFHVDRGRDEVRRSAAAARNGREAGRKGSAFAA